MMSTSARRCSAAITLSGWCVAFLVVMYGVVTPDFMVKWAGPSLPYQHVDVAQDTGKYHMTSKLLSQGCSGSRFSILEEMVAVLEQKLLLLQNEPRQNFSRPCSEMSQAACTSQCSQPLSPCLADRLYEPLLSPKLTLTEDQRQAVLSIMESVPESDVIFLSAASSNHFAEVQAMFHNLHTKIFPHMKNFAAVLVDLGLTENQRSLAEKNCKCKVITFPTKRFPAYFAKLNCYAWKSLIVRAAMETARDVLVYMDCSIRWRDYNKFAHVLSVAKQRGLQLFRFDVSARIPLHTYRQAFDYFGLKPCALDGFPELHSGILLLKREPFIIRTILDPWAKCSFVPSCICPDGKPERMLSCKGPARPHRCHRFDQSSLGILTAIAFNNDMPKFISSQQRDKKHKDNFMDVYRGHTMRGYFAHT